MTSTQPSQITILKKRPLAEGAGTSTFWKKTARGKVQKGQSSQLRRSVCDAEPGAQF